MDGKCQVCGIELHPGVEKCQVCGYPVRSGLRSRFAHGVLWAVILLLLAVSVFFAIGIHYIDAL